MKIEIADNAKAKSILSKYPAPRGATHFRFTPPGGRKPVIDALKNIDTLAGCSGELEFGKVKGEGRGRNYKVTGFIPAAPAGATPEPKRKVTILEANRPPVVIPQTNGNAAHGKGRKNKILGFSACATAKALGNAGVKHEEADRIFRAHGIQMPKASLSVQLGFGRRPETWERHGQPAAISDAQIKELRSAVKA